jgi:hypothetical protein
MPEKTSCEGLHSFLSSLYPCLEDSFYPDTKNIGRNLMNAYSTSIKDSDSRVCVGK